jgi:ribosomal protein S18 acetylase RimI-like enzyme
MHWNTSFRKIKNIMLNKIVIKDAISTDFIGIRKLFYQLCNYHHNLRAEKYKKVDTEYFSEELFKSIFDNPLYKIIVAYNDTELVGYIIGREIQSNINLHTEQKTFHIEQIGTDEKYRNLGIGKTMFNHLNVYLKEHNFKCLQLHVDERNEAAKYFYFSQGFETEKLTLFLNL